MTTIDVAGVRVALQASDGARLEAALAALAGFPVTTAPAMATFVVDGASAEPPPERPSADVRGFRFWSVPDGIVASARSAVLRASSSRVLLSVADDEDLDVIEDLVPAALAWPLAAHGRYLVHGAAVARDGRALLVLGESGAGKSSLAAAALEARWDVLSDDVVVLEAAADRIRVFGVHRDPAVPIELGGPVVEMGTPLDGPRGRALLGRGVLTSGGVELAGTILVAHATEPAGTLASAGGSQVVLLLMKSFAPTVDPAVRPQFFAFTERVLALPMWKLGHAADVAQRRAHAAQSLTRCAP